VDAWFRSRSAAGKRIRGSRQASKCRRVARLESVGNADQQDARVFGTPSIVSEVLNGKRELNKEHIRRLSERFGVSPELFF
jgi:transcriptional regulator with XRE-family HTH domain